jgi:hypothetical protein
VCVASCPLWWIHPVAFARLEKPSRLDGYGLAVEFRIGIHKVSLLICKHGSLELRISSLPVVKGCP